MLCLVAIRTVINIKDDWVIAYYVKFQQIMLLICEYILVYNTIHTLSYILHIAIDAGGF